MSWTKGIVYGFDTETTGVDVHNDRIVTATIVKIENGVHTASREWLIDPQVEIPEGATAVHGITTAHAREHGRLPMVALSEISDTVGQILTARYPLVVMNAAFDLSILTAELRRWGLPTIDQWTHDWTTLVDPFVLAKHLEQTLRQQFVKGRTFKLPALCERYGVEFVESHDATADAVGAAQLAIALVDAEPTYAQAGPTQLFALQQQARASQQASLRAYFDKKGQEHDGVDGGWPLHTALTTEAVSA